MARFRIHPSDKRSRGYLAVGLTLASLLLLGSCASEDDPDIVCGGLLDYHSADTLVVCIPDSAVAFVGRRSEPNHYNLDAYLFKEYQIARDTSLTLAEVPYSNSFPLWKDESWDTRRSYLPYPFTRDLVGASDAEFMFLIAEFPEQFGFGWTDTYLDDIEIGDPALGNIWFTDDPLTAAFDGNSPQLLRYRDMLIYIEQ